MGAANIPDAHMIVAGCVPKDGHYLFLYLQRGREPSGECRAPRTPSTGEAERGFGAAA